MKKIVKHVSKVGEVVDGIGEVVSSENKIKGVKMKNLIVTTTKKLTKAGGDLGKFVGDNPAVAVEAVKLVYEIQKGRNYRENLRTTAEVEAYHTQAQIQKAKEIDDFLSKHKDNLKDEDISKLVDTFCSQF